MVSMEDLYIIGQILLVTLGAPFAVVMVFFFLIMLFVRAKS